MGLDNCNEYIVTGSGRAFGRRLLCIALAVLLALAVLCLALMAFHNAAYYDNGVADLLHDVWLLLHARMRYNWDEELGLQSEAG